jgi:hypothetical protein
MPTLVQLAPDAYHAVSVKSGRVLQLRAGTYYFDSLLVDPSAGLQIDGSAGPVYVFVNGPVTFRGNMNGSTPTPGLPIASLTIMTTSSASILSSYTSVLFNGVVIANGGIGIAGQFRGAFFGQNVTLFEDSRIFHVRDPFSFRGFGPSDEVSVTGGSIRKGEDITDEFTQSETATSVSKNGQQFVVAVGYNDKTTGTTNPEVTYPNGRTRPGRIVRRGVSLLGWSYSTDGGYTFNYGGRVRPPTGWSAIWGDPAMAKVSLTDPNVYYAEMATTDAAFTNTVGSSGNGYDPTIDAIVNLTPNVDGHCIARSTDFGATFTILTCLPVSQSEDGTALAAAMNTSGVREVYLSTNSSGYPVFRVNDQTLAVTVLPTIQPPPNQSGGNPGVRLHPKLRVLNGVLYLVAMDNAGRVFGATLDAAHSATTWQGPFILATDGSSNNNWGGARAVSFDIGSDGAGNTKFRFMYLVDDGNETGLATRECNVDLSNCHDLPWHTRGVAGSETQPSLRNGGGASWAASWTAQPGGLGGLSAMGAQLRSLTIPPTQNDLQTIQLFPAVAPCSFTGSGYWGDYNEMDTFGDLRYFAPYTVNGPGCRYRGPVLSDQHVGASIFRF